MHIFRYLYIYLCIVVSIYICIYNYLYPSSSNYTEGEPHGYANYGLDLGLTQPIIFVYVFVSSSVFGRA